MNNYALIGNNIKYSLSPFIHNELIKKYKLNSRYDLLDVVSLEDVNFKIYSGLNITKPFKRDVLKGYPLADKEIEVVKAENANVLKKEGETFHLFNTDVVAFLEIYKNIKKDIKKIAIFGNGSTAQMIISEVQDLVEKIYIITRRSKLKYINNEKIQIVGYHVLDELEIDCVINTTPLGQGKYFQESPLDKFNMKKLNIKKIKYAIDLNYSPFNNKFLLQMKEKEVKTFTGLDMLVTQAILSFQIWNNIRVDFNVYEEINKKLKKKLLRGLLVYGMPLAGKTTLYNSLKLDNSKINMYDLDEEIEKNNQIDILRYVREKGIQKFRTLEEKEIDNILKKNNDCIDIVFLGGGTITNKKIISKFIGYEFIYLKTNLKNLVKRYKKDSKIRPLISNTKDLQKTYELRTLKYDVIADKKMNFNELESYIHEMYDN